MISLYQLDYNDATQAWELTKTLANLGFFLGLQALAIRGLIDAKERANEGYGDFIFLAQARLGKRYHLVSEELLALAFEYRESNLPYVLANG